MDGWDALVAVVSYVFGGLTVHLCYKYKKKTVNSDNIIGGNADISAGGDSVVAKEYKKTVYYSGTPAEKKPELSEQAKSFIKQLIENNGTNFVTTEDLGLVQDILMISVGKQMSITDGLSVAKDLNDLEKNGYIAHVTANRTGHIYVLTPEGREYGKSLIS